MFKKILLYLAILLFVLIGGYVFFLMNVVREIDKHVKEKIAANIKIPGCFLPGSQKDLTALLRRLKRNKNWKFPTSEELKNPNLKGLLARRIGNCEVTLIKIEDKKNWFSNSNKYFNEGGCDKKIIPIRINYDEFSGALGSRLLLENQMVGLLITEWSDGYGREKTQKEINVIRGEFE